MTAKQEQRAEGNSTAVQAGRDAIVYTGLSYTDVKQAALDVFDANFYKLAGLARQIAEQRAEEIIEDFLTKLQKEYPEGFSHANNPGFQYALFTVQKEYARIGDKDLGDLLVDLLVDRSKYLERDIMQIVLDESLNTAPKLTEGQLAIMAIVFLFKYTQNQGVGNHEMLGEYFDRFVAPFAEKITKSRAWYQHLEFTSCGAIGLLESSLTGVLGTTYQGQFLNGFDKSEISNQGISTGVDLRLFIPCLNDTSKWQIKANNYESLEQIFDEINIQEEDRGKIKSLFDQSKMSEEEILAKCVIIRPYMAHVFDVWSDSPMKNFTLTSVGMAIAHANIKRLAGEFANLAIWIN